MVFVTEKIKPTNKFKLDDLGAKKAVKRSIGLSLWQKLLIALLAGSILGLAGPGFDHWWLAWFMMAPFLVLLSFCRGNLESLLIGLLFGCGYHSISLNYYTAMVLPTEADKHLLNWQVGSLVLLLQTIALSLPTAVFAWFSCLLPMRAGFIPYFKRPFFPYLITVPLLWIFFHWGIGLANPLTKIWQLLPLMPLSIDSLVYSQYNVLPILQVGKYIGSVGLEFLVLLANAAIAACLLEFVKTQERPVERVDAISPRLGSLIDLGIVFILLCGCLYFGQLQISNYLKFAGGMAERENNKDDLFRPLVTIGLIDNNPLPQDLKKSSIVKQLAIIILSELDKEVNLQETQSFFTDAKDFSQENKNSLVWKFACKSNNVIEQYNLLCSPVGNWNIKQEVPYSQSFVFANTVDPIFSLDSLPSVLKEWLFEINKNDSSSWYSLGIPRVNWGKVGLLSGCDIADFRLVANEVRRGASLIISSANLTWNKSEILNKQLLAAAVFRAIENNRYVILCCNNGILAIIEPSGAIQALSGTQSQPRYWQKTDGLNLLLGTVQFLWSKTAFTKAWWL